MTKDELLLWRRSRGLSQTDIATMAGVSLRTIGNWERGISRIPDDAMTRLVESTPEGKAMLAQQEPAELPFARFRPYPWGRRDYTLAEVAKVSRGSLLWELQLQAREPVWRIKKAIKLNVFVFSGAPEVTLPPEAFPDPASTEAPWARAMHDTRLDTWNDEMAGVREAMKDAGIPDDGA